MTWLPWLPWLDIYLWGLRVATVAQVLFVGVFLTTRWRSYRTGRALFIKSAALAAMLCLSLAVWYRDIPHLLELGAILMWLLSVAICYLLWSVIRQKIDDRRPSA